MNASIEPRIRTGPYLQNPAADAMTVMWMTTVLCSGLVEYGPTRQLGFVAETELDGLKHAGTLHRVRLTNLPIGQSCFYRVVAKPIMTFEPYRIEFGPGLTTEIYRFTTPDPAAETVRFIVFNDLHDDVSLWKDLYKKVQHEPADFVLLNGDLFDFVVSENQIVEHLLDVCTELFATRIPFIYVRGNHDTRGVCARHLKQYLDLPDDRFYYSFSWGPATFVALDAGEDKPDHSPVYAGLGAFESYRVVQRDWLAKEIESDLFKSSRYRIVLHHIPARYNVDPESDDASENFGAVDVRSRWWPLLNQAGIDLFLAGHTHCPTIKPADPAAGHHFPVVIGGGPEHETAAVILVDAGPKGISVRMVSVDAKTLVANFPKCTGV
jgi:predicted MPP superfamily phosphohydrolase